MPTHCDLDLDSENFADFLITEVVVWGGHALEVREIVAQYIVDFVKAYCDIAQSQNCVLRLNHVKSPWVHMQPEDWQVRVYGIDSCHRTQ